MDGREMLQKVVLSFFVLGIFTFLSYFFVKKYLLVGASGMLWAVQ